MIKAFDISPACNWYSFKLFKRGVCDDGDDGDRLNVDYYTEKIVEFLAEDKADVGMPNETSGHRLPCTSHALQLVMKEALQQLPVVFEKILKEA